MTDTPPGDETAARTQLAAQGFALTLDSFCHAAECGDEAAVRLFLAARLANASARGGRTPLHCAADRGHLACVDALLRTDVEAFSGVDQQGPLQQTACHVAAAAGHTAVVARLIAGGADVGARGVGDVTALHLAAESGSEDCVQLLLEAGGGGKGVLARYKGWTPLHYAARGGHTACAEALLDYGANEREADADGVTPLQLAERGAHAECAALLKKWGQLSCAVL